MWTDVKRSGQQSRVVMLRAEMTTGSSSREENRFKVWHDGGDWFKKIVVKSGWLKRVNGSGWRGRERNVNHTVKMMILHLPCMVRKMTFLFFSLLTFTHLQPPADSIIVVCGLFLHTCQILTALPKWIERKWKSCATHLVGPILFHSFKSIKLFPRGETIKWFRYCLSVTCELWLEGVQVIQSCQLSVSCCRQLGCVSRSEEIKSPSDPIARRHNCFHSWRFCVTSLHLFKISFYKLFLRACLQFQHLLFFTLAGWAESQPMCNTDQHQYVIIRPKHALWKEFLKLKLRAETKKSKIHTMLTTVSLCVPQISSLQDTPELLGFLRNTSAPHQRHKRATAVQSYRDKTLVSRRIFVHALKKTKIIRRCVMSVSAPHLSFLSRTAPTSPVWGSCVWLAAWIAGRARWSRSARDCGRALSCRLVSSPVLSTFFMIFRSMRYLMIYFLPRFITFYQSF